MHIYVQYELINDRCVLLPKLHEVNTSSEVKLFYGDELILVEAAVEGEDIIMQENEDLLLHHTKVLLDLLETLSNTDLFFCGDFKFPLVGAEDTLKETGMLFISRVNIVTK